MPKNPQLLLLELNELNFGFIETYVKRGELPNFRDFFARHGYEETESERSYEELEPWIQWVTAHTGLTYAEHGIFRLGDIAQSDLRQIWEDLESEGLSVGAVSPMNAKLQLTKPAFFIPDPWTETGSYAQPVDIRFYQAIRHAVSNNASGKLNLRSLLDFAVGGLRNARPSNYFSYLSYLATARRRSWTKALFLDQLIADLFVRMTRARGPDFASVFLNAGAHIQHHYMFSSAAYDGPHRNPDWYIKPGNDPLLDVYRLYDRVIGQIGRIFPGTRIMLATGLHQVPYKNTSFYWRLIDHAAFLAKIDVPYRTVEPRMSRDFLVSCRSADEAEEAAWKLRQVITDDADPLFEVDNRGTDLFVTLVYPYDVPEPMACIAGNKRVENLRRHLAFVAIKNGEHDGIGYFSDSGQAKPSQTKRFALAALPERVRQALGLPAKAQMNPSLA